MFTEKVVCYYGSWSVWRAGNGHFEVFYINPNICTHIMYSFLGVDEDGQIVLMDPWLDAPYNGGRSKYRSKSLFEQLFACFW